MSEECSAALTPQGIRIKLPYRLKDAMQGIHGREWKPLEKCWIAAFTVENVMTLSGIFGMRFDEDLNHVYRAYLPKEESADLNYSDETPLARMPLMRGIIPYRHQIRAFNLGVSLNNAAILHEQGVGKTLTAICILGHRALHDGVRRVVIVCPVSVIPVWQKEIEACLDYVGFNITALEGSGKAKAATIKGLDKGKLQIVICNYEAVWRDPLDDALLAWKPEMIIADESQRIKNHAARQSKMMHELGKRAKFKLILSGTPVMNTPLDFFSQYKFLDDRISGTSFYAFQSHYAIMAETMLSGRKVKMVVGSQNLGELVEKAHSIASRVTKEQCLDLPNILPAQFLYFQLSPEARRVYRELQHEMASEIRKGELVIAQHIIVRLMRLAQVTGGFVTVKKTDDGKDRDAIVPVEKVNAKLELYKEVVQDLLDAGKKVVVFAHFLAEITAITEATEALTQSGTECGYRAITGDVPMADRGEYVREFQENPSVKVFIAQIQTAGLGITLTAADTAIFYSCDYSYANHEQAKARIHRIGQTKPVTYIYLVAKDTIDEDVLKALDEKKDIARLVVDEWRTLLNK